ncbi:MAG: flavin reductase family protein [Acutalibacteraceae bacterium]|jgi:flavin reductase (DIM6/NTAB) family NADH-FMN oxidoreductase RutF
MSRFRAIPPEEWEPNPFEAIGRQWMLITAGDEAACNTMTASWGGVGVLWGAPVSFIFVRHSRHTFGFVEKGEYYSLCFFPQEYRPALALCGRVSGRDTDKIADAGLTPVFDREAPYFAEASTVIVCRKQYADDIRPEAFADPSIARHYADEDYHRMYVGEIVEVLVKED